MTKSKNTGRINTINVLIKNNKILAVKMFETTFSMEEWLFRFCAINLVAGKSNPKLITQAIESFILYLENSNSSDIKLIRLGNNQLINYSTLASRLRAVLGYLDYLLDNFSQEYGKPLNSEITRYKSIIAQKNKMVANLSATHNKNHKAKTNTTCLCVLCG